MENNARVHESISLEHPNSLIEGKESTGVSSMYQKGAPAHLEDECLTLSVLLS